jgi:signal recognition particle subunit SRP54
MLQQMQRQMRSGGGMQEMMKAMMRGQGGDQMDMEEMQSMLTRAVSLLFADAPHAQE